GSASDPAPLQGLSKILQATLDAGTSNRSSRIIAEELQALGADMVVGVSKDMTYLGIDGLSDSSAALLRLLSDIVRNATYPAEEVKLAIENEIHAISANKSHATYELDKVFYQHLFGDHPYAFINPDPEVIERIRREDLLKTHRQRLRPDQSLLVMVGNLSTEKMEKLAREQFGNWSKGEQKMTAVPPAPNGPKPALLLVDRPRLVQSSLYVGRPLPAAGSEDEFPLEVANTIFGGAFGSRLTMNLREDKGYSYSPHSYILSWARGGLFRISASVRNEVTAATLVEIFYELDRLAATLPEKEELARAQRYLKGSFLLDNETSPSVGATLVSYWIVGKTPGDLAKYVPGIERVEREDVRRTGKRYFASRGQTVAISGDAPAIRNQLSLFGEITVITEQ
ncbi:MAG TPA: insulinase family protein, partial [Chromatiaceae bacterium]|nr:insulinase family protein [Chromatiaceae bacterium]